MFLFLEACNFDPSANVNQYSIAEPATIYGVSKLAGEHLAAAYFKQFKLPTVSVRPFNIYGPGQTGEGQRETKHLRSCRWRQQGQDARRQHLTFRLRPLVVPGIPAGEPPPGRAGLCETGSAAATLAQQTRRATLREITKRGDVSHAVHTVVRIIARAMSGPSLTCGS